MKTPQFTLCLALLLPALAAPADLSASRTPELVHAMRMDDYFVRVANKAAEDATRRGTFTEIEMKCMQHFTVDDFSQDLSTALVEFLTPEEIRTALEFYQSPTGVWLIKSTMEKIAAVDAGDPAAREPLHFKPDDEATTLAFQRTSAGEKLLDPRVFINSKPGENAFRPKIMAAVKRCSGAKPAAKPAS